MASYTVEAGLDIEWGELRSVDSYEQVIALIDEP